MDRTGTLARAAVRRRGRSIDAVAGLLLVAALVAIPYAVESRYVLGQVILALFLSTVASQWNLLFGYAGVFSLAQMAVFGFGGYATAMLCVYGGLNLWLAIPIGALAAVALSLVVGLACLRLSGVYVALLTLAIAQALYLLIVTDTDCFTMVGSACRQLTGGAVGFARFGDLGTRAWLKARWLVGDYAIASVLFCGTMLATYAIINSPVGLAFRALKDNPGYAVARGVNRFQAQLLVFGLSAFFTGLAGGFYAGHFQAISPAILSLSQLLFIIAATVVGGVGSFWGPVVGTVVLMLADEAMREAGSFRTLGLGLIIAAAIVLMPNGLVGRLGDLGRWWRARRGAVPGAARPAATPPPLAR
jgi:branched-chain amino acid transport system permease protein